MFNDNGGAGSNSGGSGGSGTGGAIGNVHNAGAGGNGGHGSVGTAGLAGTSGSSAGVGVNTPVTSTQISGGTGGAGGAGGLGGQGGGGGGGRAGGGGGGGGGGSGAVGENGGNGGIGGAGGKGGGGGVGANGTDGGDGGAGGGAFEIVAGGTIASTAADYKASFYAVGGAGGDVTAAASSGHASYGAYNNNPPRNAGRTGGQHVSGLPGSGGAGGYGGYGYHGGDGGGGGTGVPGAGGAGGTILLAATDVEAATFTADADGGLSGTGGTVADATRGGVGRVIVDSNTQVGGSISTPADKGTEAGGTASTGTGAVVTNPFVTRGSQLAQQFAVQTPPVAGLYAGADVGGLLNGVTVSVTNGTLTLSGATGNTVQVVSVTPDDAVAILRVAVGPGVYDQAYSGYDMLLFVNLSGQTIAAPAVSMTGAEGASTPVALTNLGVNGSAAETALSAFGNGQVWATLVPHSETLYVSASVGGSFSSLSGFANGRLSVLTGISATTTPDAVFLTTVPVATTLPGNVPGFNAVTAVTNVDGTQLYAVNTAQGTLVALNVTTCTSGTAQFTERQLLQDTTDQNASGAKQPQSLTGVVGGGCVLGRWERLHRIEQQIDQFAR